MTDPKHPEHLTNEAVPAEPSAVDPLQFPMEFPLKVMGKNEPGFTETIADVLGRHIADFDPKTLDVRHLDGKAPELYISNLRTPGSGRVERASQFLSRELATRQFHPGYIKGLMAEGYATGYNEPDSSTNVKSVVITPASGVITISYQARVAADGANDV